MKSIFTVLAVIVSSTFFGQVIVLEENFDAYSLPTDWIVVDNDGHTIDSEVQEYSSAWITKEDPTDATNGTISSTSYFSPVDRADRWLITPQMTIGASGNFISWNGLSHDPSFPDSYKVMVSKSGNTIADFTDTLVVVSHEMPIWKKHTKSLSDYNGEDIYIAFVNTTYNGFKLYLDSVYVREQDPLALPTEEINLAIYPNPITDIVHLFTGNATIQKVEIYNSYGQKVEEEKVENSTSDYSLSVAHLQPGIYFISVETSLGVLRKKIVK